MLLFPALSDQNLRQYYPCTDEKFLRPRHQYSQDPFYTHSTIHTSHWEDSQDASSSPCRFQFKSHLFQEGYPDCPPLDQVLWPSLPIILYS